MLLCFYSVEQDGTYSATVSWNRKGGYRIDFWGQGNDLTAIPLHAARAYYKTGIFEHGSVNIITHIALTLTLFVIFVCI